MSYLQGHVFYYRFRAVLLKSLIFTIKSFVLIGDTTRYILVTPPTYLYLQILSCHRLVSRWWMQVCQWRRSHTERAITAVKSVYRRTRAWCSIRRSYLVHRLMGLALAVKAAIPKKTKYHQMSIPMPEQHWRPRLVFPRWRLRYAYLNIAYIFCLFLISTILLYRIYIFFQQLPSPTNIGKTNYALTTHISDRTHKSLYEFYTDANRTPIKLHSLPSYVAQATIAVEDKDFYHHFGISPIGGIARAVKDWLVKRQVQGGSTLTQQLVKMSLLSSERTLSRKISEAVLALETERYYTKDQILEMYLNQVPYGGAAYGIQEASRMYFGKSARDLTIAEAALLAGLPQAPSLYSPFTSPESSIRRRDHVLLAMKEQGYITAQQLTTSRQEKPKFVEPITSIQAPHFVFYTKQYLEQYFDAVDLDRAGYKVQTSLDLDIQQMAQKILQEELEKIAYLNVTNGAVLVTDPKTGEILAMVGSVGYFSANKYGAFNVTTALRQPGSSFKPILYLYSLVHGYTAATTISDTPTNFHISNTENYRPVNYDGRFHGWVTLRTALANSFNIPAVKLMEKAGVANVISFAKSAGIDSWEDPDQYGLSLSLGGGEVTMLDMAEAYSVLANQGVRSNLTPIKSITDAENRKVQLESDEHVQIVDPAYTYIISDILSDNQARTMAFGAGSQLEIPGYKVAVKTGTTDIKKDNWTIGYTPDYLVVVWVGNNDGTPMNQFLSSGVTGAAPIWHRVMQYLLEVKGNGAKNWYDQPPNVAQKICMGRTELFISGSENSVPCALPTRPPSLVKKPEEPKSP